MSIDGSTLFVTDVAARNIQAFDLGEGIPRERRLFATLDSLGLAPRGITVCPEGRLYVVTGDGIAALDGSGAVVARASVPTSRINDLCWGGPDRRLLFFTTPVGVGYLDCGERAHAGPSIRAGAPLKVARYFEAFEPAFSDLIDLDQTIEPVCSGGALEDFGGGPNDLFGRSLEGCVWLAAQNRVIFSDIGNSRIVSWNEVSGFSPYIADSGHTNGSTLDLDGALLCCEHSNRRIVRHERDGTRHIVVDRYEGALLNRPNDIVVHSSGRIYFSNPWWDFGAQQPREMPHNGVLSVSPDRGAVDQPVTDMVVPNGLCFSPDERILYVNDSRRMHIRAYPVRPDGTLDVAGVWELFRFPGEHADGLGSPDGMKVDAEGNIYCGGPGGLWVMDPKGTPLGRIVHGATQTNNLCFFGSDLHSLFMATWMSAFTVRTKVAGWPIPGSHP